MRRALTDSKAPHQGGGRPEITVVAPVSNAADSIEAFVQEIAAALSGRAWELVVVDDSSIDDTRSRLHALKARFPDLRVLGHRKPAGQGRAIRTGVAAARAAVVVTVDGEGRDDPAEILGLAAQLGRADAPPRLGLVQGRSEKPRRTVLDRLGVGPSSALGASPDDASTMRAFRRDAYNQLPYFDQMHRYLPALMKSEGYEVEARTVKRRPARRPTRGEGGLGGFAREMQDLRGVMWLRRGRQSPGGVDEL
jgi:dolichol-phosphate mannosyltransferase